jgi:hypothetical protein
LLAQLRQGGAIDPLGTEHVDVVELGELLGRKGLGRAEHHVAGVANDDVDVALLDDNLGDAGVDGLLRADVEFDGAKIDALVLGIFLDVTTNWQSWSGGAMAARFAPVSVERTST